MESKVSKAQLEVWEMKERLYEQIKDIPSAEQLIYIKEKTAESIKKIFAERKSHRK